ncbi:hypothetical protein C2E23DRAFT_857141 [Lenzites betulinus]|nr:hypothetical protein C2E23DRAFT_857141 [Lenzites betulinus]
MDMPPMGSSPINSLAILLPSYTASTFAESMLFGAYAVVFLMGAWSLLHLSYLRRPSRRDLIILSFNTVMFLLALSHIILSILVTQYSSLDAISNGMYNASNMLSNIGSARFSIYVTQTLICDTFMTYRTFVIWERQWKMIVIPGILLFLDAVSGYISTTTAGNSLFTMILFPCSSFSANSVSTALIMGRVFTSTDGLQPTRSTLYRKVIRAIVQSAALYSTASVTLLLAVIISPNSVYATCLTFFPPFIGLIFSLVILRLARRSDAKSAPSLIDSRQQLSESRRCSLAILPVAERARSPTGYRSSSMPFPSPRMYDDVEARNSNAGMMFEKSLKFADAGGRETCERRDLSAEGSRDQSKEGSAAEVTE